MRAKSVAFLVFVCFLGATLLHAQSGATHAFSVGQGSPCTQYPYRWDCFTGNVYGGDEMNIGFLVDTTQPSGTFTGERFTDDVYEGPQVGYVTYSTGDAPGGQWSGTYSGGFVIVGKYNAKVWQGTLTSTTLILYDPQGNQVSGNAVVQLGPVPKCNRWTCTYATGITSINGSWTQQ